MDSTTNGLLGLRPWMLRAGLIGCIASRLALFCRNRMSSLPLFRQMGHEREARLVMIEKNRDRARFTRFPHQAWWWYNFLADLLATATHRGGHLP